jgi:hypothetical protein
VAEIFGRPPAEQQYCGIASGRTASNGTSASAP